MIFPDKMTLEFIKQIYPDKEDAVNALDASIEQADRLKRELIEEMAEEHRDDIETARAKLDIRADYEALVERLGEDEAKEFISELTELPF